MNPAWRGRATAPREARDGRRRRRCACQRPRWTRPLDISAAERHQGSPERRRADREVPAEPLGELLDADQAEAGAGAGGGRARAAVRDLEQGVPSASPHADLDLTPLGHRSPGVVNRFQTDAFEADGVDQHGDVVLRLDALLVANAVGVARHGLCAMSARSMIETSGCWSRSLPSSWSIESVCCWTRSSMSAASGGTRVVDNMVSTNNLTAVNGWRRSCRSSSSDSPCGPADDWSPSEKLSRP